MTTAQSKTNYLDVSWEYFGPPDEDGLRLKHTDVWYAVRPTAPGVAQVTYDDEILPGHQAVITTAWSINKAGLDLVYIYDRDDINGLRALLDAIELKMDQEDMASLQDTLDNHEEDE